MFSFFSDVKILSDFTGEMFVVWLFSVGVKKPQIVYRIGSMMVFMSFIFSPEMALSTAFVLFRLMAT